MNVSEIRTRAGAAARRLRLNSKPVGWIWSFVSVALASFGLCFGCCAACAASGLLLKQTNKIGLRWKLELAAFEGTPSKVLSDSTYINQSINQFYVEV